MSEDHQPVAGKVGIIALVPDYWKSTWQVRHQILTRLAGYFHIVWMEPPSEWREAFKKSGRMGAERVDPVRWPGLWVYRPEPWLPKFYHPDWLARLMFRERLKRARRTLTKLGCQRLILYIWRPDFAQALELMSFDLSCYHVDDEYTFSEKDLPVSDTEAQILATADQVFIHSSGLMEKKGQINPQTSLVPNGVDFSAFSKCAPEPSDLSRVPHPRIGYIGYIKKTLDWPLLIPLIQKNSQWSFVFVGPIQTHPEVKNAIEQLVHLPNVHFLSSKSNDEVAAYPQHFDVCIMPYRLTDYTRYGYPLKLHEYLASGRPVIGVRMRTLEEFSRVVSLPGSTSEWEEAIAHALTPEENSVERREARRAVASQHDWRLIVGRIARTMALRLGPEVADQVNETIDSCVEG